MPLINQKLKIDKKSVLIFGITGQDGSLLANEYLKNKFKVYGVITTKRKNFSNLKKLKIIKKINLFTCLNVSKKKIEYLIKKSRCSIVYLLSGISSVSKSQEYKYETILSSNLILIEILEFLRLKNLNKIKVFNASSGEIFGDNIGKNNEESKNNPLSYYGVAKTISLNISKAYRKQFKLKIFNGILFNHESNLRPKTFVIKKVINGANMIFNKKIKKIILGNTNVFRDWGWAPEYIKILYDIMKTFKPDDYIIATGKITKLDSIVKKIFNIYKLDKNKYIQKSKKLNRVLEPLKIQADISKLKKKIRYVPKISINNIIKMMIAEEQK